MSKLIVAAFSKDSLNSLDNLAKIRHRIKNQGARSAAKPRLHPVKQKWHFDFLIAIAIAIDETTMRGEDSGRCRANQKAACEAPDLSK